jgi:2',3'-cyclic-nucleotide 2'-phosphodiesterase (5'-nucleotidase family)
VLSHIGLDADRELAGKVKGIDVIVGGHSHTVVKDPVIESGTVIVQAGSNGVYLGVIKISFDPKKKKVIGFTRKNELRLVSSASGAQLDPNVAQILDLYESKVKAKFSKVIGTAAADLTRNPTGESLLGDLVTDAMRQASSAQIAFQNGGGIRADIHSGPITLEKVFTALPFDDVLVSMDLTGEQIRGILEKSVLSENMLQVSGMQIEYDPSKPAGSKVASARVAGKPMDDQAAYRVVTNDFLAAGGDRFNVFKQGKSVITGPSLLDVVSEYIHKNSPVKAPAQNRIVFKN